MQGLLTCCQDEGKFLIVEGDSHSIHVAIEA